MSNLQAETVSQDGPVVSDRRDATTTRNDADVTIASDGLTMPKSEAASVEQHEAILADGRKLSTKGKLRKIPIDQLWRSDNPRELYDLDPLVESIRLHGFRQNEAIMVVERENPENPDQRFLVVRGNRRTLAVERIRDDFPDDFGILFPQGKVPCISYAGCSDRDVALLRMDFDTRAEKRGLDGWEQFLAVRILVKEGIHTESTIAQILGMVKNDPEKGTVPNRSVVQPRVRLAKMPVDVQNLFKPVLRGDRKSTALRVADIQKLATAFRKGKDNPDSPVFREMLDTLLKRENPADTDSDDSANPIKHKDLKARMNSFDSPILREILKVIVFGEGTKTLVSLDAQLVRDFTATPDGWDSVGTSVDDDSADSAGE